MPVVFLDAVWAWIQRLDVKLVLLLVIAGLMVQERRIAHAEAEIMRVRVTIEDIIAVAEPLALKACLDTDSLSQRDLQLSRTPCARLFEKYGIQR